MKTKSDIEALANDDANKLEVYQRDSRGNHITGFIAGYTACQEEDRWISVEDEVPPYNDHVLLCNNATSDPDNHWVVSGWYEHSTEKYWNQFQDHFSDSEIFPTHWQPMPSLPNPPKK